MTLRFYITNLTLVSLLLLLAISFKASSNVLKDFQGIVAPAIGVDQMPYKAATNDAYGSLLVMGRSNSFFFEGNRFGYFATRTDFGGISVIGQVRSHQYLPDDKTNKAFELGAQISNRLGAGWFSQVTFFTDISDTHQGQELEVSAYRRDSFEGFTLLSMIALQQQSKQLTATYSNADNYSVSSGDLNAEIEFIGTYRLTEKLRLVAVYRHYLHGNGLSDSPLVDSGQTQRFLLGLGWAF